MAKKQAKKKILNNNVFQDYVFLKYYNYRHYYAKREPSDYLAEQWQIIRSQISRSKNAGSLLDLSYNTLSPELQQFEDFLNSYFYPRSNDSEGNGITESEKEVMDEAILRYLAEHVSGYFNPGDKNLKGYSNNNEMKLAVNKIRESKQFRQLKHWYQKMIDLQEFVEKIRKTNPSAWGKMAKEWNILKAQFNKLINETSTNSDFTEDKRAGLKGGRYYRTANAGGTADTEDFEAFKNYYNSFRRSFLSGSASDKTISGQVLEAMLAAAGYILNTSTTKTVDGCLDFITKHVVGNQKGYTGIQLKTNTVRGMRNFASEGRSDYFQDIFGNTKDGKQAWSYHSGDSGDGIFNSFSIGTGSQNKIDVSFEMGLGPDSEALISAKNYSLDKNKKIKFVSGTNLLAVAGTEPAFMHHYLNITQNHSQAFAKGDPKKAKEFGYPTTVAYSLLKKAHLMMKRLVLLKSLTGGLFKYNKATGASGFEKTAELVIINNNDAKEGEKHIRIFTIEQIMSVLENKMENVFIEESYLYQDDNKDWLKYTGFPKESHRYDITGWESEPWDVGKGAKRMAKLYAQLHKIKIKTEVSLDLFKKSF